MKKAYKIIGGAIATVAFAVGCTAKYIGGGFISSKKKEKQSMTAKYDEKKSADWEDGKLDAKELSNLAKDYLAIQKKLKDNKDDLDEKEIAELEKIADHAKKVMDQYVHKKDYDKVGDKYVKRKGNKIEIKVAYVINVLTPAGDKVCYGSSNELKAVKTKSIDDVAKDFTVDRTELIAKLLENYTPLDGSYENLKDNTYVIEITKKAKGQIRAHLRKGLEGKVNFSAEKVKELTDGKNDNGEITGAAVQPYEPEGLSWTEFDPVETVKKKKGPKVKKTKKKTEKKTEEKKTEDKKADPSKKGGKKPTGPKKGNKKI